MSYTIFAIAFILTLTLTVIFIPLIIKIAHKNELFDSIDHRKTHTGNIPRLGGVGFILSMIITYYLICNTTNLECDNFFIFTILIIFSTGLVDDLVTISAIIKLIAQCLAIFILIFFKNYTISHVLIPYTNIYLNFGILKILLTAIWIIGISNAINLLDGMDGQAGGVSFIASIVIGVCALILEEYNIAMLNFILAGSLLGFLFFNFPPAKIFMGDSGSLTIGFILAIQPLMFSSSENKGRIILVVIAVLLVPILDVFSAIIRRTKLKISFFEPDRGHIHHKFQDYTSLSIKKTLIIVYCFVILSGILSFLYITNTGVFTTSGLFINLFIHIGLFLFLHKRKKERSY